MSECGVSGADAAAAAVDSTADRVCCLCALASLFTHHHQKIAFIAESTSAGVFLWQAGRQAGRQILQLLGQWQEWQHDDDYNYDDDDGRL